MTPDSHSMRYAAPDDRPARIVLDGTSYRTDSLMRCPCGLVVVNYRDPDARGPAPRAAHGLRLDALTTGRAPGCGVAS